MLFMTASGELFEEGDLVQLKSGGPVMSVQMLSSSRAVCMWFDEHGKLQESLFLVNTLKKAEDRGKATG